MTTTSISASFHPTKHVATWAERLLLVYILLSTATSFVALTRISVLCDFGYTGAPQDVTLKGLEFIESGLAVVGLLALLLNAIFILRWVYWSYRNASFISGQPTRFSAGLVTGSFFIPVLHLILPYLGIRELWRLSLPTTVRSRVVELWWGIWVGDQFLSAASNIYTNRGGENMTLLAGLDLVEGLAGVVLSIFLISIIRQVTSAQAERAVGKERI